MESPDVDLPVVAAAEAESEIAQAAPEAGAGNTEPVLEELSVLAVRDTVLFPNALLPLSVGRASSVALVESLGENRLIAVVSQVDPRTDVPGPNDLHGTGTVALIHKIVKMREGQLLFCEGVARMRVRSYTASEPFLRARIERLPEIEPEATPELTALRQNVLSEFTQLVTASCRTFPTSFPVPRATSPSSGGWRILLRVRCPA